jgi:hypothetical protein
MQVVEPYMIIRSPNAVEIQEKFEMETKTRKTKDLKRRRIQLSSVMSTSSATVTIVV